MGSLLSIKVFLPFKKDKHFNDQFYDKCTKTKSLHCYPNPLLGYKVLLLLISPELDNPQ